MLPLRCCTLPDNHQHASQEVGAPPTTPRKHGAPRRLLTNAHGSLAALDVDGDLDATAAERDPLEKVPLSAISVRFGPVFYNVREPLRQFRKFLMEVPRVSSKVAKLARLVWCKASTASEFDVLINTDAWSAQVRVLPTPGSCCTVWLLLSNTANFDRRVVQMTRAFPMRLLWLAKAPTLEAMPSASTSRRRTHQYKPRLLGGHRFENTHSVPRSTISTQSTGCASVELFASFFQVACHLHADTREIEAVNSVIQHQVERAGVRGSLNLLSDQLPNSRAIHLGEGSTPKWSELQPHVARARAEAMHWFPSNEES